MISITVSDNRGNGSHQIIETLQLVFVLFIIILKYLFGLL